MRLEIRMFSSMKSSIELVICWTKDEEFMLSFLVLCEALVAEPLRTF